MLSRMGWPHPGFFVSTTTTPVDVTNTAVLPPPPAPLSTKRLSFSFSTSMTFGAGASGARGWLLSGNGKRQPPGSQQHGENADSSHDGSSTNSI